MSAAPEDVMALATAAWDKIDPMTVYDEVIEEIARAIMADRAARPSVPPVPDAREEAIAECLAHIEYVRKNIVIPPSKRKRFDLQDLNVAFRNALMLAKEQITGENADKWMTPEQAAERQRLRAETEASR